MVEVILTDEVLKLGSKGDVVRVAPGYARNYLFPKQLAIPATATNKTQIDQMRTAADREAANLRGDAEKLAEVLSGLTIRIVARAGDADQLFGSVTSRDIAAEIEKLGYTVDRHKILIDRPIRMVGEHDVKVHLHRDIDLPMTVRVLAEGREHEAEEGDESAAGEAPETPHASAQETAEAAASEQAEVPSEAAAAETAEADTPEANASEDDSGEDRVE